MIRERWSIRPAFIAFYPLSPTLLFADYRKYLKGPDKTAAAQCAKRLNKGFFGTTLICLVVLLLLEHFLRGKGTTVWKVVTGATAYYAFSRRNEIFIAFILDATSHLRAVEHTTDLKYYERIQLAMRSYLELILDYAIVVLGVFNNIGGFSMCCECSFNVLSAIYFSGVTIATIGYGDIHPIYWFPQLLAIYEVLNGIALIVVSFTVYVSRSVDAKEFQNRSGSGPT